MTEAINESSVVANGVRFHYGTQGRGPLVMLVVHGSQEMSSLPTDLLWRAFSLTESEARLAEALLNGATLADFAKEREVSKQTLRNQLVGVMRKTGTRQCLPGPVDPAMKLQPWVDFSSGYFQRAIDRLPKQGSARPWTLSQNYISDLMTLRHGSLEDGVLRFSS